MKRICLNDLVPCLLLAGLFLIVADASRLANRTKGEVVFGLTCLCGLCVHGKFAVIIFSIFSIFKII